MEELIRQYKELKEQVTVYERAMDLLKVEMWIPLQAAGGKVASFLCAVDPGEFEPEEGHTLHGDIEFFYRLTVGNSNGGSMAESLKWNIEVFKPIANGNDEYDEAHLKLVRKGNITKVSAKD